MRDAKQCPLSAFPTPLFGPSWPSVALPNSPRVRALPGTRSPFLPLGIGLNAKFRSKLKRATAIVDRSSMVACSHTKGCPLQNRIQQQALGRGRISNHRFDVSPRQFVGAVLLVGMATPRQRRDTLLALQSRIFHILSPGLNDIVPPPFERSGLGTIRHPPGDNMLPALIGMSGLVRIFVSPPVGGEYSTANPPFLPNHAQTHAVDRP